MSNQLGNRQRDRAHWLLVPVLLTVLAVSLHFCLWKSGMFIDEIYTYGLSNSHYMPFIGGGGQTDHDTLPEQVITREEFFDYLAVTEGEPGFDLGSVYYNQTQDVHPPLYYWILNFFSTLARGQFSKWIGLIPDLLIYLGTLVLLYVLGTELFGDPWIAAAVTLLYGLSQVGLSTMLMIRMYVLVCFLTVLLALLVTKELREPDRKKELGIGLTIFTGLMTQYYFVFYAFFLCAAAVIVLLWRRDLKAALFFAAFAFLGVGMMLLCFPAVFAQMTGQRLGPESDALANLKNLSAWSGRLRYYFGQIRVGLPAAVAAAVLALAVAGAASIRRKVMSAEDGTGFLKLDPFTLRTVPVLLLPVIPTIFVPAVISPVLEGRYIYNIMPICALAPGFCLWLCRGCMTRPAAAPDQSIGKPEDERFPGSARTPAGIRLLCGAAALLAVCWSLRTVPDYIYDEHREYNAVVAAHAEAPCVYLTEYYAGVTQDMLQLMAFDEVYVTADPGSERLRAYLEEKDADELVVYIDIDSMWGSGFDPRTELEELGRRTGYPESEHLYQYALSDTYLMRR